MHLYTAPQEVPFGLSERSAVFLAGSIEQGSATDWQTSAFNAIADLEVAVFNPRRKSWDPSWEQSIDNPEFAEQVNWELDNLNRATIRFFYFEPDTKSPITLMELGYVLGGNDADLYPVIVVCPDGFWRKGNVEIMCARAEHVSLVDNLTDGLEILRDAVEHELRPPI
jgi:hypothetical protein